MDIHALCYNGLQMRGYMDVTTIVTVGAVVLANIGTVIGMFMWATGHASADTKSLKESTENSITAINRGMYEFREKWAEETRDFHGRLERQDAEFKAFMRAEEQKRTQILMKKG